MALFMAYGFGAKRSIGLGDVASGWFPKQGYDYKSTNKSFVGCPWHPGGWHTGIDQADKREGGFHFSI